MNNIDILLQDFVNGRIEQDKLENYKGGYKMGFFYTKDLQRAISTLIAENKELKEEKEKIINKLKEDVELASTTVKRLDEKKQVVPTKTIIVNESDYAKTILKIMEE